MLTTETIATDNQFHNRPSGKSRRLEWLALAVILLAGLVFRGVYLSEIVDNPDFTWPMVDGSYHNYWARSLVSGNWTLPPYTEDPQINDSPYFRPPGYPYFLALVYLLTGSSYVGVRIVQMGLGLIGCALGYLLVRDLFGRGVALICATLMSTYWAFIYFEGELLAPVLLVLLSLLLFNALSRWSDKFTCRSLSPGAIAFH